MGKITGFLEKDRKERKYLPIEKRVKNHKEFILPLTDKDINAQAARCMDCGIPYCHNGCPVNNQIPDWNDLVYKNDWQEASRNLHSTNNFPEFTGRICPAPCEASCTLNLIDSPVTIKTIECAIVDRAWQEGWITPQITSKKTGKRIAIIGAGPAGLAAAQQLARAGHEVHVYEKNAKAGGLLRYGIPDFKMEKQLIDKRIEQMEQEGVIFHYTHHIGVNCKTSDIIKDKDAVLLTGGAEHPRDLPIKGRELDGVYFAMDFLTQQNRRNSKEAFGASAEILAKGKHVVVIGGGDTGSDCIGTSNRQGAASVTQLEIMPMPPEKENKALTWPDWPLKLRTSSSQEEGAKRDFSVMTKQFLGENGKLTGLECIKLNEKMEEIANSNFTIKADLVLLAMGFTHPVHEGLLKDLKLTLTDRGNIDANVKDYQSSQKKIFAAGDIRRGQSLVVWAIREGRQAAHSIDRWLTGSSNLSA
ncbi:MAG: glutamate synthase subunit beta [Parvibaculales bacterium]